MDRWDELAMLPLDDEEAVRLLASVPEERRTECWWFVRQDRTPVAGDGGGGVALLTHLRLTRPLGRVLGGLGASRVIDVLDKLLSKARGKLSHIVPDGEAPRSYP